MTVALGVDLSLRATGLVALSGQTSKWPYGNGPRLIHKACISTADLSGMARVARISEAVQKLVDWLKSRGLPPRVIVIEGPAFSRQMGHSLGQLHGVVKMDLVRRPDVGSFEIVDAPPTLLKKFATGKGNVDKNVMMKRVCLKWGFDSDNDNECDAYAAAMVGLCLFGEESPEQERQVLNGKVEVVSASADHQRDGAGFDNAAAGEVAGRPRRRRIA